jgi:predicted nucleic acid-binding protein
LVDTTVWVDFFANRQTPQIAHLEDLLNSGVNICTCGVILAEVLQGIRKDADYHSTKTRFSSFLYLPMSEEIFIHAADLYRSLRRKGITIRKPVDCMIAAVALQHNAALLHNDRDFDPLAEHCGLQVAKPKTDHKP